MITKQIVLQYLEDAGWTEIIDTRFERQLIKEILFAFPNISKQLLEEVLDLVLIRNND